MRYQAIVDGAEHELEIEELNPHSYRVKLGDQIFEVDLRTTHGRSYLAMVGNRAFDFGISSDGDDLVIDLAPRRQPCHPDRSEAQAFASRRRARDQRPC